MEQRDRVSPEDDYLAPPDLQIAQEPQQARRRIVLALVCFLTLPLCACSFSDLAARTDSQMVNLIIYTTFGATFAFPFFVLGRYQNRSIRSALVWTALGLLALNVTLVVLEIMLRKPACCGG